MRAAGPDPLTWAMSNSPLSIPTSAASVSTETRLDGSVIEGASLSQLVAGKDAALDSELRGDEDLFGQEFEVERYLEGHAQRFVRSFDPNCYLYLGRSMDLFDVAEYGGGDVMKGLAGIRVERAMAIGVHTDILFPLQQQEQIAQGLRAGGAEADFLPLPSPQGHDAFLVDIARFGPAVAGFLNALPAPRR